MKRTTLTQAGSLHLAAFAVIAVLAVVGFVGYKVADTNSNKPTTTATANQSTSSDEIKSTADVQKASTELDATAVDTINPDQLDQDLNSLL